MLPDGEDRVASVWKILEIPDGFMPLNFVGVVLKRLGK